MVRLFHIFRQELLKERKYGRYYRYALGEILLVMIGILLAFQVDSWNDRRKNNVRKESMLKEIHIEFSSNLEKLDVVVKGHKRSYKALKLLASMFPIDIDQVDLNYLSGLLIKSTGNWTFDPLQSRIKSFINSPDFHLVEDELLQKALINWSSVFQDYHEDEIRAIEFNIDHYYPYYNRFFPLKFYDLKTDKSEINFQINLSDERFDKSILKTIGFENNIYQRLILVNDILHNDTQELETMRKTIERIVELTAAYVNQ